MVRTLRRNLERDMEAIGRERFFPVIDMLCANEIQMRGGRLTLGAQLDILIAHVLERVKNAAVDYEASSSTDGEDDEARATNGYRW